MRALNRVALALLFVSLGLTACKDKKGDDGKAAPAPAKADAPPAKSATPPPTPAAATPVATVGSWQPIPNSDGLIADVPASAIPHAVGGGAGFHAADGSMLTVSVTSPEEAAKDLATTKQETEKSLTEFNLFTKWLSAATTADGFALTYEGPKLDDEGNPAGSQYSFHVRRQIGGKPHTCSGAVATEAQLATALQTCASVRAK